MDVKPLERGAPGRLRVILRALAHRNYRLFFFGQSVSLLGTWMQQIAMTWLVFYLTRSAFMLGVVSCASNLPLMLLGPFAGVWADRWDRRCALLITQSLLACEALLLAVLALTGVIEVWHILILSACSGFVNALDGALRSAFLAEMVETGNDLGSAIALSSFVMYGARALGPPLAGGLIALVEQDGGVLEGTGICFLLNAASYLAVCAALGAMRVVPAALRAVSHASIFADLKEGMVYAIRTPPIRALILMQALVSLVGVQYALMPVVARDMLGGGASTLGLLMGSSGFGAVAGSVVLAAHQGVRGTLGRIAGSGLVFGLALVGFSFSHELWISAALCTVIGFTMMMITVAGFTLLQTTVADDKRGRVVSLYLLAFWGMTPLGNLLMGSIAEAVDVGIAFLLSGACCLAGFVWFALQLPVLRPLVESGDEPVPTVRQSLAPSESHHHA